MPTKAELEAELEELKANGGDFDFDSLSPISQVSEQVRLHHDQENKKLLIEVDISKRLGVSKSGKTVGIANAGTYYEPTKKLNLNVYDTAPANDDEQEEMNRIQALRKR